MDVTVTFTHPNPRSVVVDRYLLEYTCSYFPTNDEISIPRNAEGTQHENGGTTNGCEGEGDVTALVILVIETKNGMTKLNNISFGLTMKTHSI